MPRASTHSPHRIIHTSSHVQMIQHGVTISSLRTSPGPSQTVSDILAVLVHHFQPTQLALLGFAAGGLLAPLAHFNHFPSIQAVDLDPHGYNLFRNHCPHWVPHVQFHLQEAVGWLRRRSTTFPMIIEDLSVPRKGDVFKPDASWSHLPGLIQHKIAPQGVAIFNMLPNPDHHPQKSLLPIAARFASNLLIELQNYENLILLSGTALPSARTLSHRLKHELQTMGSFFSQEVRVRTFPGGHR